MASFQKFKFLQFNILLRLVLKASQSQNPTFVVKSKVRFQLDTRMCPLLHVFFISNHGIIMKSHQHSSNTDEMLGKYFFTVKEAFMHMVLSFD